MYFNPQYTNKIEIITIAVYYSSRIKEFLVKIFCCKNIHTTIFVITVEKQHTDITKNNFVGVIPQFSAWVGA